MLLRRPEEPAGDDTRQAAPMGAPGPEPRPGGAQLSRHTSRTSLTFHQLKDEYLRDPTEMPLSPKQKSPSGSESELPSRMSWFFHPVPWLRKDRRSSSSDPSSSRGSSSTLYDRLGGEEAIISLVCVFIDALLARFIVVLSRCRYSNGSNVVHGTPTKGRRARRVLFRRRQHCP